MFAFSYRQCRFGTISLVNYFSGLYIVDASKNTLNQAHEVEALGGGTARLPDALARSRAKRVSKKLSAGCETKNPANGGV